MTDLLVLTNESDYSLDRVIHWLRSNTPELTMRRVNRESAHEMADFSASLDRSGWIASSTPRTVWLRQFLPERNPYDPALRADEIDDVLIRRRQWLAWLATFDVLGVRWVNHPASVHLAESKVRQLATAVRVELVVPETLLTSSRDEAMTFKLRRGRCIVKSVASAFWEFSDQSFFFTSRAEEALERSTDSWYAQPVLVQEEIEGSHDARLLMIGEEVIGGMRPRTSLDWRTDPNVAWSPWEPDHITVDRVREFADEMHLNYGAFDFILGSELHNSPVFLECNPSGEFGFLDDTLSGEPSASIGRLLAELADREE